MNCEKKQQSFPDATAGDFFPPTHNHHQTETQPTPRRSYLLVDIAFLFRRQFDFLEATLAFLPALAGILLHVRHLVALVDNFEAEDGLNDVLQ